MGIKEKLNENPQLGIGVAAGAIVCAALVAYFSFAGGSGGGPDAAGSGKAFYSVDDGQTYFTDDAEKLPPFDHGGKQAVRAYVFESNGKKFVNHLERWTPEGKKIAEQQMAAMRSGKSAPPPMPSANIVMREVKRPGGKDWVSGSDMAKAGPVISPHPPSGTGGAVPVEP